MKDKCFFYILTDGEKDLELGISLFEFVDSLVKPDLPVLGFIVALKRRQLALLEPPEGENHVGAKGRVDVLGHELAHRRPILRPVGVVANQLVLPVLGGR